MARMIDAQRNTLVICLVALALLLQGCVVYSIHPFCRPDQLVEYDELTGYWQWTSRGEQWLFQKDEGTYNLVRIHKDKQFENYEIGVFRVGDAVLLDAFPLDAPDHGGVLGVHQLLKLENDDGGIQLVPLDYDWLQRAIDDKKLVVEHFLYLGEIGARSDEGVIVLSAETRELGSFAETCVRDELSWNRNEVIRLTRVEAKSGEKKHGRPEGDKNSP